MIEHLGRIVAKRFVALNLEEKKHWGPQWRGKWRHRSFPLQPRFLIIFIKEASFFRKSRRISSVAKAQIADFWLHQLRFLNRADWKDFLVALIFFSFHDFLSRTGRDVFFCRA